MEERISHLEMIQIKQTEFLKEREIRREEDAKKFEQFYEGQIRLLTSEVRNTVVRQEKLEEAMSKQCEIVGELTQSVISLDIAQGSLVEKVIESMKDQVVKVMKAQSAEKEDIEESITKKVDLHEAVLASRACKLS